MCISEFINEIQYYFFNLYVFCLLLLFIQLLTVKIKPRTTTSSPHHQLKSQFTKKNRHSCEAFFSHLSNVDSNASTVAVIVVIVIVTFFQSEE